MLAALSAAPPAEPAVLVLWGHRLRSTVCCITWVRERLLLPGCVRGFCCQNQLIPSAKLVYAARVAQKPTCAGVTGVASNVAARAAAGAASGGRAFLHACSRHNHDSGLECDE